MIVHTITDDHCLNRGQSRVKKMLQSGVGSMQGYKEDCIPMKGHTQGENAPTVLPIERTHRGGDTPTM